VADPATGLPWAAYFTGGDKPGVAKLNNNAGGRVSLGVRVLADGVNSSPRVEVRGIFPVARDIGSPLHSARFMVPAYDPDGGAVSVTLGDAQDHGGIHNYSAAVAADAETLTGTSAAHFRAAPPPGFTVASAAGGVLRWVTQVGADIWRRQVR